MHIYITEGNFDPALIPEARERFDRIYRHRPNQKIVIHKAQYPWSRLEEWETTITDATASDNTLGIVIWGISEQLRLINLRAIPMRGGNREQIEAILAATDVPRDAIQLNIGGGRIPAELTVEKVSPGFKDTFTYWVEAQPRAQYGETVNLKLIIRNQTSEPALIYGGYNSLAFVISNERRGKRLALATWPYNQRHSTLTAGIATQTTGIHWRLGADRYERLSSPTRHLSHQEEPWEWDYPERLVTDPVTIEILPP